MINRALLRTKSVQVLYSMYVKQNLDLTLAESEIAMSAQKSYELYHYIMLLMIEVQHTARIRNEAIFNRLGENRGKEAIDNRFINNRFIQQLEANEELQSRVTDEKLSWSGKQDVVKSILKSVLESDYYAEYIANKEDNYQADKELWRKILKKEILDSEDVEKVLEDENLYWYSGVDLIVEFIIKTIKMFDSETGSEQPLLPKFDTAKGESLQYAIDIVDQVLLHSAESDEVIKSHLQNWELHRVPIIDRVILKCAIAEMTTNPMTPKSIIINEYVEIAKHFSSPKSAKFINGVLDKLK